jgi:hypothetical protein
VAIHEIAQIVCSFLILHTQYYFRDKERHVSFTYIRLRARPYVMLPNLLHIVYVSECSWLYIYILANRIEFINHNGLSNHGHVTEEAQVRAWVSPRGICGHEVAMGQGFFQVLQFSFVSIIPPWLSIRIYNLGG